MALTIFLGGDVMTGRGVDQILPHPGSPELREPVIADAGAYRELAERANGPIPAPVDFGWPWGDALDTLAAAAPDVRLVNLETSVTRSDDFMRAKGVHYRMHPANLPCLTAAGLDVCALANNHVGDFGERGLLETLDVLSQAGIAAVGAGRDEEEARHPAVLPVTGGRVIVLSLGTPSSGIPRAWAAAGGPGVNLLAANPAAAPAVAEQATRMKRPGDVAVVSIHWGGNWGFDVPTDHVRFAHALVDGGVDVVHGHSSHHPRPVERYRDRLILYGCGELLDDYEGIRGHEDYRPDLRLCYLVSLEPATGRMLDLRMVPFGAVQMRLRRASRRDTEWLRSVLDRVSRPFGARVAVDADGALTLGTG
jgi:poly-gamma-glutamate capsule biosynthesis protein CapA/YwtB (metallophosphatase superfamily)